MKLISLNVWGGKVFGPLMDFIKKHAPDTDIFCLEEVPFGSKAGENGDGIRDNLFAELQLVLSDFQAFKFMVPAGAQLTSMHIGNEARVGMVIFIRKGIPTSDYGCFFTYPEDSPEVRPEDKDVGNFQHLIFETGGKKYVLGHVHGLWQVSGKFDTPERLEQSRRLVNFFAKYSGPRILCGDFNLRPGDCVQSLAILEAALKNLIQAYNIENTRTPLYKDMEKYKDYIADYVFVSPEVKVKSFKVLPEEVSDHAALMLEFE